MKPKIIFEQYSIPHYRVPFFDALAKKVDLVVVASKNPRKGGGVQDTLLTPGFRSIRLDSDPSSGLYHPGIIDVIRTEKPDVLISWNTSLRLLLCHSACLALLKEKNTKVIWMGCDGYETQNLTLGLLAEFLPWRLLRTLRDRRVLSRVDHFLAHSSHMREYLKRVKRVPAEKITVAHNAIDTSGIVAAKAAHGEAQKNEYGIVFTGRLIPGKNIETLLRAFAGIVPRFPAARLTIIGEGPAEEKLKALARMLAIEEKTRFCGGIYDDARLTSELSKQSLFVLPGVGGLALNTAMAAGLPIIHTFADGTEKDLVTEGVNGWFFDGSAGDLSQKISLALSDPAALFAMGRESERRITRVFTLEKMVDEYSSAIEKLTRTN